VVDDVTGRPPVPALAPGAAIVALGETAAELGGSEWAAVLHGLDDGPPPAADLARATALHALVADLVSSADQHGVVGVHDVSDGGLAVALAEMAFGGGCGFDADLALAPGAGDLLPAFAAFSESASRVVLAVDPSSAAALVARAHHVGVPAAVLGNAGGERLRADGAFDVALADAEHAWRDAIPRRMAH
jgi:phosphoribosylformylglycinamidine synthase subunit PurL